MHPWYRWLAVFSALFIVPAAGLGESAPPPILQATVVEVDLSALPANEKAALTRIIHAARRMDTLYMRQVWPGTAALLLKRTPPRDAQARAEQEALNFFKGPWDQRGKAFIPGVPATRPIADFYPAGTTKDAVAEWLATLPPHERERALGAFTVVRPGSDGRFGVEPYCRYYASELRLAADDLRAAAALTHEPTLKQFLLARAQALLDDNYYASDVAFVGLRGPIDVVLGPYEVDDDDWFGVKTAFESSIALVDKAATERLAQIASHLQELEDHLPLAPELRGRRLAAAAPVMALDVIYHGGLADAGGAAAGYGLPNDLRVLNAVGARTGSYTNVLKLRYQVTFLPIATAALAASDRLMLRFEDIRDEILMVRLFDSLGPQLVTGTKQPIADALRENSAVAGQVRSMLLSLWGHRYLIEHGYLDAREAAPLYAAFLVPALARLRGGLGSSASQGSTYVLNRLIEAGVIHPDPEGRLTIDAQRADAEVVRAANEFISAMAKGDADTVRALLRQYVVVHPQLRSVLERMGPVPPPHRLIYHTADQLDALTVATGADVSRQTPDCAGGSSCRWCDTSLTALRGQSLCIYRSERSDVTDEAVTAHFWIR